MERKMATIRRIDAIAPIEGADLIHAVKIGGWTVVAQKSMGYNVGDLVVYCEIDSFIPTEIAPFLTAAGHTPKEYNGVKGERLKTKKLKGVISQGLLLPLSVLAIKTDSGNYMGNWEGFEGHDVSERLGIQKWEPPADYQASNAKGNFPHFIPKTCQERIQNIHNFEQYYGVEFEVTEKLDGSSMTVYVWDELEGENRTREGVCSRNLELKNEPGVTFWEVALRDELHNKIRSTGRNLALQGELIGPGIQGNKYKLNKHVYAVYNIYDIDRQEYLLPEERQRICSDLRIMHVPVLNPGFTLGPDWTIEKILKEAEFKSSLNAETEAEGYVLKRLDGHDSFKAISNKWLLKHE